MERGGVGGKLRKEPVTPRAALALSRDARTGTRTATPDCDSYRRYAGGGRGEKGLARLRDRGGGQQSDRRTNGRPSLGPPRRGRKRCAEVSESESTERRGRLDMGETVGPIRTVCRCSDNLSTSMRGLGLNDEWH